MGQRISVKLETIQELYDIAVNKAQEPQKRLDSISRELFLILDATHREEVSRYKKMAYTMMVQAKNQGDETAYQEYYNKYQEIKKLTY